ncbi:unnamed protein product [Sphagnum jensenii]|uniref:AMP-dependent synthetase/ligase domain-containing protein n=1 Tax=Sphagnum jensenii TaxID=128206 RepID=A0ABP1A530_9BRYO
MNASSIPASGLQGYGFIETSAGATFSDWDDTSVRCLGPPVPCCCIKIVIGGPSVTLGYFKNQAKSDEVLKMDEREVLWFYTGDVGQFHEKGCIEIIDRKRDIVKLQHGEYVSLGKVEAVLAVSIKYSTFAEFCERPEFDKEVLSSLSQVGKIGLLERVEIPTKIKLLPEPWTPETGLVTAAMNIMREAIRKHFADDLNELYHQ